MSIPTHSDYIGRDRKATARLLHWLRGEPKIPVRKASRIAVVVLIELTRREATPVVTKNSESGEKSRVLRFTAVMSPTSHARDFAAKTAHHPYHLRVLRKCCNFENGDGGRPERNWAARSQAARSNSWSMN